MSKNLIVGFIAIIISVTTMDAQRHELGVRFGVSSLVGDIGRTNYLLQAPVQMDNITEFGLPLYGGLIYRMNFNPHQTLRFDVGYSHIQFDDREADEAYRRNRQMWGTNNLLEADAIFEYNFFPVNNEQDNGMLSPYIFAGFGAMMHEVTQAEVYHDFNRDANGVAIAPVNELDFVTNIQYNNSRKVNMFIPFGVGLKYKFNYNWAINGEIMLRPTFTDQLDYSVLEEEDLESSFNSDILAPSTNSSLLQTGVYYTVAKEREAEFLRNREVGDANNKDWVNSVTLGLTYSFGRPPCYCD